MIITETTVATSVTADTAVSLEEIASQAAVTLVLGATAPLSQATLTSEVLTNGAARAIVRGLEPEPANVSITVTATAHEPVGLNRKRVLMSAIIVVAAETISCSQALTNALLASVPNRMIKPIVVIRSPVREQPMVQIDGSAWREILAWRRARL
jgi:hypothetical protein